MEYAVYEDKPNIGKWLKAVLALPVAIFLVIAVVSFPAEMEAGFTMAGTAVLIAVIFWIVIPRKYVIYADRVKIVLGGPFSIGIPLRNIKTARIPKGIFSAGVNWVTSFRNELQIVTRRGLNINITSGNRELFLEHLNKALEEWQLSNERGAK
jgi:hypothetical protein